MKNSRRNFLTERAVRPWKGLTQGGLESPPLDVSEERLNIGLGDQVGMGQMLDFVTLESFSNRDDSKVPSLGSTLGHQGLVISGCALAVASVTS